MEWDGWPDGDFCRNFAWEELEATKNLRSHWSYKVNGGYRNGDELSPNWERGKKTSRRCMGVMLCDNHPACGIVTRPQTTAKGINAQLQKGCECGAHLIHQECPVRSFLWQWSGGIYYQNGGDHEHKRPTHLLHLLPKEEARFQALVRTHPTSGPRALITGVPTFEGPGESVAEISDVLLNVDRVSKERAKLKHGIGESGDNFLESFAKFEEEHPDFIILSRLGKYTVISTQTAFMRSQLVKDYILDGPLNGMVSDAAHGFWKDRKALLMVSSTYSPVLHCWVPGVVSYTNGASTNHFAAHFLAVLQSITHEAEGQNISVTDDLFKNIMDFSEAERSGFINGFIQFWTMRANNTRTAEELAEAAKAILRGCEEHFRAAVTRVSRINGAVGPNKVEAFKTRALGLLSVASGDEFDKQANLIIRDFPKLKPWMECACSPSLFLRKTNYFSEGIPIRYRRPEAWKVIAAEIGRTKPTHAEKPNEKKRKKNDGRPPDTIKELLNKSTNQTLRGKNPTKKTSSRRTFGPPSYPWKNNSCWLDTALELLYIVLMRDHEEFLIILDYLDENSALKGWFWELVRKDSLDAVEFRPFSYFQTLAVDIERCSGCESTGGKHLQISNPLRTKQLASLAVSLHAAYQGKVTDWFQTYISMEDVTNPVDRCWRNYSDSQTNPCSGKRKDTTNLVVSLPVILILEVEAPLPLISGNSNYQGPPVWDFPATLFPSTQEMADDNGLIFDIVGLVLASMSQSHFVACYISQDDSRIFEYDGKQYGGFPVLNKSAKVNTHLVGTKIRLPVGFHVHQAPLTINSPLNPTTPPPSSPVSLPNSPFNLKCLCGLKGDGNISYNQEAGVAIQCSDCGDWSHLACQRDGRASDLPEKELFICDFCDLSTLLPRPVDSQSRIDFNYQRSGCGTLAQHGDYWYPVRLIQPNEKRTIWEVRWWRYCEFSSTGVEPNSVTSVELKSIVDALWNDRTGRRKI
ncbi:hypothetical protein K443DRAFT_111442, partial [Laccaria amethystina LaAM-08-1]